ncbi:MAG TPA: type III pantothenate kinase [Clostridiaceae bacterium]|nr:type III pantothenate kinase [Clostridiaceae bacterium]
MILVIDVGNTSMITGVYKGKKLLANWIISTDKDRSSDELGLSMIGFLRHKNIDAALIKAAVISNVVPPIMHSLEQALRNYFNIIPIIIGPGVKTGINIKVENPKEVGTDIIANAVAAFELYGGPVIVVDFGTATTFSAISRKGDFIGTVLCPGIKVSAEALFQKAAKLLRVDLYKPSSVLGRNTVSSLQSGIINGYAGQVEHIIELIKNEMGESDVKVVATGGFSRIISDECKSIDMVNDHLTLEGLRIIYEKNK